MQRAGEAAGECERGRWSRRDEPSAISLRRKHWYVAVNDAAVNGGDVSLLTNFNPKCSQCANQTALYLIAEATEVRNSACCFLFPALDVQYERDVIDVLDACFCCLCGVYLRHKISFQVDSFKQEHKALNVWVPVFFFFYFSLSLSPPRAINLNQRVYAAPAGDSRLPAVLYHHWLSSRAV